METWNFAFIIIFSMFMLFGVSSLGQIIFEKTLNSPEDQYGFDVIQTEDSCYIIVGGQYDNYYQWPITDYMMFKVDKAGNLLWEKSYLNAWGETWGRAVRQTQDGGFISCGRGQDYDACLILSEPGGDTTWSRKFDFGEGYGEAFSVCQTGDGNYFFTGMSAAWSYEASIFVCGTNTAGEQLWLKKFHEPGKDDVRGTGIIQASDENLAVCGYQGDTSVLIKLSPEGDSLWMKRYVELTSRLYSLDQTEDEGFVSCGTAFNPATNDWDFLVIKTGINGDLTWVKTYSHADNNEIAEGVRVTDDKGYVICGHTFSLEDYNRDVLLIRTNSDGDTLWTQTFGDPDLNEEAYGIDRTFDGGFIITGYKQVNDTLNNVYLIKTDADGHTTWIWEAPVKKYLSLQIFPNPNDGEFVLDAPGFKGPGDLEVRDGNGRLVRKSQVMVNNFQVNLQPCSPGLYFASLRNNTGIYTAKFLILSSF